MGSGMRRTITSTEQSERRPLTARYSEIDTKTRLLDTAERLFSDRGFEAVSHRDIAVAAAVNLAAVNYHFGSKDRFIRAVIKRRVDSINTRRLAALARAERQEGNAPVPTDKILEAFFGPAVEDSNGGFQKFLWIGSAANAYRDYFISLMAPVLDRFAGALRRSLPARSAEDCQWYIYFSLTILAFVLAGPRCLSGFSSSLKKRKDASMIARRAIQFVCMGLNGQAV
jgi:AcrR family transcriptional regulator